MCDYMKFIKIIVSVICITLACSITSSFAQTGSGLKLVKNLKAQRLPGNTYSIMNLETGRIHTLSSDNINVSPNKKWVVIYSKNENIRLYNVANGTFRLIGKFPAPVHGFQWDANSKGFTVYSGGHFDHKADERWTKRTYFDISRPSNPRRLSPNYYRQRWYSPNGKYYVAILPNVGSIGVTVIKRTSDGKELRRIPDRMSEFNWALDSRRIFYKDLTGDVPIIGYVFDIATGAIKQTNYTPNFDSPDMSKWKVDSFDGKWAIITGIEKDFSGIYLSSSNTGRMIKIAYASDINFANMKGWIDNRNILIASFVPTEDGM